MFIVVGGGLAVALLVLVLLAQSEAGQWLAIILSLPIIVVFLWIVAWAAGNAVLGEQSNVVPMPVQTIAEWVTGD